MAEKPNWICVEDETCQTYRWKWVKWVEMNLSNANDDGATWVLNRYMNNILSESNEQDTIIACNVRVEILDVWHKWTWRKTNRAHHALSQLSISAISLDFFRVVRPAYLRRLCFATGVRRVVAFVSWIELFSVFSIAQNHKYLRELFTEIIIYSIRRKYTI